MADTTTTVWTDYVETAFDTAANMYLTDMPAFRALVDKRPVAQAMPGDVIQLTIHDRLATTTSTLSEGSDVTPVAMPAPRRVPVTLAERGNVVQYTNLLTKVAFTGTVAADIGFQIAENQNLSLDDVYRALFDTGTNVLYVGDSTVKVVAPTAYNTANSNAFASARTLLKRRRSPGKAGALYVGIVHPDVSHDIRQQTGDNAWVNPHQYVDTSNIYVGEVGTYQGIKFIENPRCTVVAGTPDVYTSYVLGREAAVEAVAEEPHTVVGPVVDKLKRFQPVGWYGILGSSLFRQNSLQLVKSSSSIESISTTFDPKA